MLKMTKVLYITSVFDKKGGAEKNLFDIICNLDKEKFAPYLWCLTGGEMAEEIKKKGVPAEVVDLKKILSGEGVRKGIRLYKFIKKENIQLVVTYHHDADIWGGVVAKISGVPVVSSRRDIGYQLERKHIWAYRLLNRFFTRIVSVSDAVKREIGKREWANPDKIITIYNGVEFSKYNNVPLEKTIALKKSLGIGTEDKVIGMLSTFRPVKGHKYLVQAVKEIVAKHKDIKVLVFGYKETDYYREIEKQIKNLGLEGYFICPGETRDIPLALSTFDIFVTPSESEGFSNAIIEAMAAGKPVIATNSGGNPEAVVHGVTGLLVPPCNSNAIYEAIETLLNDMEFINTMGIAGQKRVCEVFGFDKMINTTERLYNTLLFHHKSLAGDNFLDL